MGNLHVVGSDGKIQALEVNEVFIRAGEKAISIATDKDKIVCQFAAQPPKSTAKDKKSFSRFKLCNGGSNLLMLGLETVSEVISLEHIQSPPFYFDKKEQKITLPSELILVCIQNTWIDIKIDPRDEISFFIDPARAENRSAQRTFSITPAGANLFIIGLHP